MGEGMHEAVVGDNEETMRRQYDLIWDAGMGVGGGVGGGGK